MYKYNARQYRSPQRVWDIESQNFSDQWVTIADFDIELPDGRSIHIPTGFMYDKASIPKAAWWWLPRDDRHILIAALVHDYLYTTQQIEGEWTHRDEADRIFYDLIRQAGMRWSKAKVVHAAVRLGGWRWFNKTAKDIGNSLYVNSKG